MRTLLRVVPLFALVLPAPFLSAQVTVSPKGTADPNRIHHTSGNPGAFAVTNTTPGGGTRTFLLTCGGTGVVACDSVRPTSLVLANGGGVGAATAYYRVGNPGPGQVWAVAAATMGLTARDSGWRNVTVVPPAGAPVVDFSPYLDEVLAGDRCAAACFTATHAQSTVPYYSLDAARNVTLVYHGDRVSPRSFFLVNVQPDAAFGSFPTEYRFALFVGALQVPFVQGETLLRFSYPGNPTQAYRIGGQIPSDTLSAYSHGVVYPVSLRVSSQIGGVTYTNRFDTQYLSINEEGSPIARGWTVAGHQRLYVQADGSVMATDGTGNVAYFRKLTSTTWRTPTGEFSVIRPHTSPAGFIRAYPDSLKVYFNVNGFADSVKDRFGNRTWYQYDAQSRLRYIWDPAMQLITFNYGASGLQSIVDATGRTTSFTLGANRVLTHVTDPDNVSTQFGYDASRRLNSITDRAGAQATLAYDASTYRLTTITPPAVPIHGAGNQSPTTTFVAWQPAGVPYGPTNVSPHAPVHVDSVRGTVTDPLGHATRFTVDRWGQPRRTVDALGQVTTVRYTTAGLPDSVVRPGYSGSDFDRMTYNADGLPLTTKRAGIATTTTVTYGAWAQPTQIQAPGQQTVNYVLGTNGRVDTVKVGGIPVQRYGYDARGRVTSVADGKGVVSQTIQYQTSGYLNSEFFTAAGNRTTWVVRDNRGRPGTIYRPQTAEQIIKYDSLNRVRTVQYTTMPANVTTYTYNTLYLTSVVDAKSQSYGFAYNAVGWKTQQTDPAGRNELFAYNRDGALAQYTNRRSQVVTFGYDALHRKTGQTGSQNLGWRYLDQGLRVIDSNPGVATDTVILNVAGLPTRATTVMAGQTYTRNYFYSTAGLLDSVKASGGGLTFVPRLYGYDTTKGALTSIGLRVTAGQPPLVTSFQLDPNLQDTSRTLPGGDRLRQDFGSLHAPLKITSTGAYVSNTERWFGLDSLGRIDKHLTWNGLNGRFFTYDPLGRLVKARRRADTQPAPPPPGCPEPNYGLVGICFIPADWQTLDSAVYAFDAVGNRTDLGGTYGAGNRISAFDSCAYGTDFDGNVTTRTCGGVTTTFVWNVEGQLDSVHIPGTGGIRFRYDASGRLVQKRLNGSSQARFLWDGWHLLAELGGAGTTRSAEYSYYPGADRLHGLIVGSQLYRAHVDGLGNVIALTDTAKTTKRLYDYRDWGVLDTTSQDLLPFGNVDRARWKGALWLGPELDAYFMRERWYEPRTGRFLSEDPIGLEGGINGTTFASSDPANGRDPFGLQPWLPELITSAKKPSDDGGLEAFWWTIGSSRYFDQWQFQPIAAPTSGARGGQSASTGLTWHGPTVLTTPDPCVENTFAENFASTAGTLYTGSLRAPRAAGTLGLGVAAAASTQSTGLIGMFGYWASGGGMQLGSRSVPAALALGRLYVGGQAFVAASVVTAGASLAVNSALVTGVAVGSLGVALVTCAK